VPHLMRNHKQWRETLLTYSQTHSNPFRSATAPEILSVNSFSHLAAISASPKYGALKDGASG